MPRIQRQASESGYYHVMLRGNARQLLFESDDDRRAFLSALDTVMEKTGLCLLAWCLMDNHVHFVVDAHDCALSDAMRSLAIRYAHRFNQKADRVGHVFQDRYRSKPIESDAYLLEAVRYVHNNPLEIGASAAQYPWSSYHEYTGTPVRVNPAPLLEMIGGADQFPAFCSEHVDPSYVAQLGWARDEDASVALSKELLGIDDLQAIKAMDLERRNDLLLKMHEELRLSIRMIERLTGIGRGTVAKAVKSSGARQG